MTCPEHVVLRAAGYEVSGDVYPDRHVDALLALDDDGNEVALDPVAEGSLKALLAAHTIGTVRS